MAEASHRIRAEILEQFCMQAMVRAGMSEKDARTTATVLVTTDTWGVHTHGSKQLRNLMKDFREGKMDPKAATELLSEGPSWALFDGHRSMPMISASLAMRAAMEKARDTGIAYSVVRDSGHFGAAGFYANMAALEGMIGICMCNVDPGVAVPGSRGPVLGTNPFSYAVPAGKGKTVFLDIATSVVAASKVFAARSTGKPIPDGWLVDKDGLPTTDPSGYPQVGALLPMAGHKGYGIALMVEILTGVLSGGPFGRDIVSWIYGPEPVNQSLSFIAINVGSLMPAAAFAGRMEELAGQIHQAPKALGAERIYLPGEKEWENRDRALKEGMILPPDVLESLRGVAADLSLDASGLFDRVDRNG
jgi:ureidoglycolate dehydrogenase (NAD+)